MADPDDMIRRDCMRLKKIQFRMKKRILILLALTLTGISSCFLSSNNKIDKQDSIYVNYNVGEHEWYLTNPEDSVKLFILEFGRGIDTILVLHGGFGAEHRYLKDAFEGLYDQYHFIFYDQRGSLRSPCPEEKISIERHISDIEAIRKEFGLTQINIFGHSNGTTLATYYLKAHPDKVKGFIMTACMQMQWPIPENDSLLRRLDTEAGNRFGEFLKRDEIQKELSKVEMNSTFPSSKKATMKERIRMASYYLYDITLWQKGKEPFGAFFSNKAARATVNSLPQGPYDNIELYRKHPYPITIIMGEYDMIDAGGKKFEYWTRNLPNVYHVLIEKAGHDPWIDQPDEYRKRLLKALTRYP